MVGKVNRSVCGGEGHKGEGAHEHAYEGGREEADMGEGEAESWRGSCN